MTYVLLQLMIPAFIFTMFLLGACGVADRIYFDNVMIRERLREARVTGQTLATRGAIERIMRAVDDM